MNVYWTRANWKADGRIALVAAPSPAAAMVLLGLRFAWEANLCTTPDLVPLALALPGTVISIEREELPSAYDRFRNVGGPGWDYQAMEDEGYDVS